MNNKRFDYVEFIKNIKISYLIICLLIILIVLVELGFFPFKIMTIASESMEPTINVGDVVIYEDSDPINIYNVGDIIIYKYDNGKTIVHRINNKLSDTTFKTKGDNNLVEDDVIVNKLLSFIGW